MTVAEPFLLTRSDATELLGRLKRVCGGGGTLTASRTAGDEPCFRLEVQGDHVARVVGWLEDRGFRAKRSGG